MFFRRPCPLGWSVRRVGRSCSSARAVLRDHEPASECHQREPECAGRADAGVAPVKPVLSAADADDHGRPAGDRPLAGVGGDQGLLIGVGLRGLGRGLASERRFRGRGEDLLVGVGPNAGTRPCGAAGDGRGRRDAEDEDEGGGGDAGGGAHLESRWVAGRRVRSDRRGPCQWPVKAQLEAAGDR